MPTAKKPSTAHIGICITTWICTAVVVGGIVLMVILLVLQHKHSKDENNDDDQDGVSDWFGTIVEYVGLYKLSITDLTNYSSTTCNMTDQERCPLSAMAYNMSTVVLPGGKSRCIFDTSSAYKFQVVRGNSTKVLMYFQGGGACWDEQSTEWLFCTSDANISPLNGMLSPDAEINPKYYDYTLVEVLYCSGDVHGGNVTREYSTNHSSSPVVQVGAENTLAVLSWLEAQQLSIEELVVAGCSAGALGAQVWGDWIVTNMRSIAGRVSVLPDSFVGLFPPGVQGPLIKGFGLCNGVILEGLDELNARCNAATMTVQDLALNFLERHPQAQLSFVNSKTDVVQIGFYNAIVALDANLTMEEYSLVPQDYYQGINQIFQLYEPYGNSAAFLVSSSKHCFTDDPFYVMATTDDATGREGSGNETLQEWVVLHPAPKEVIIPWECSGKVVSLAYAEEEEITPSDYCDEALPIA